MNRTALHSTTCLFTLFRPLTSSTATVYQIDDLVRSFDNPNVFSEEVLQNCPNTPGQHYFFFYGNETTYNEHSLAGYVTDSC
jgi:hypothetical protein